MSKEQTVTSSYDQEQALLVQANEKDPLSLSLLLLKECPSLVRCNKELFQFNGRCYDLLQEDALLQVYQTFIRKYGIVKAWSRRHDVVASFRVLPDIPTISSFNDYPSLMCIENGVLDIYTRTLSPHSHTLYFDSFINVSYDPSATSNDCPAFLAYLNDTFNGDQETIDNIIRLGGYLLDPSCDAGKMFIFDGPGGCLDKETFIPYTVYSNQKPINHKGGSIEMLYERFHNKPTKRGKGGYHLRSTEGLSFKVSSINENNSIFKNEVVDVVKSGQKECFKLTTSLNKTIVASADHKFFTGSDYIPLSELRVGDTVFVHNNTHYKNKEKGSKKRVQQRYVEWFVKYHPSEHKKSVNGCQYFRLKRCRAVIEASMNGMTLVEYRKALNTQSEEELSKLVYLPKEVDVHHINKDSKDDRLENLVVLTGRDHDQLHTQENYDKMRFIVIPDTITSITSVGLRETYDIKCLYPYNNFLANGLVVHNSGKSTLINTFTMFFNKTQDDTNQVTAMSLDELASGSFDKEDLIKSRVNFAAEAKKGYLDAEEIKKIVTGDLIKVSRKFGRAVTFVPKSKIVVACNGLPKFTDTSDGIYRRLVLIRFVNQYRSEREIEMYGLNRDLGYKTKDPKLMENITKEKNAIFALFLEGLIKLKNDSYEFLLTKSLVNAVKEFRKDSDTVREFLEDNYEYDPEGEISGNEIYKHFRDWYRINVADSAHLKLRSAEMGKRIKETFGISPAGRKIIFNHETCEYEKPYVYNLSRIVIYKPDPSLPYVDPNGL